MIPICAVGQPAPQHWLVVQEVPSLSEAKAKEDERE
jgi:hypothetical protein